jgi:hypothetical protein
MRKLALAVLLVSSVTGAFMGCSSSPHKVTTGTGGKGGSGGGAAGSTGGTGGAAGGAAGDNSTGGTGGSAGGATGGTGGAGGAAGAAGTGGAGGAAGAAGTGGAGGTTGNGGTGGGAGATPPPITSGTTVLEIDDVTVQLKPTSTDGGADGGSDAAAADAGTADGGSDGGADAGTSPAQNYTFKTTTEGWKLAPYGSSPTFMPSGDNYATTGMLVWGSDDADGVSTSGSLKGTIPFQHDMDQIDFQAFSNGAGMYDWTGYIIHAKVKLASGGNLKYGCPLSAVLYVSDNNNYTTRLSGPVNLVAGQWVTVTYDMADATLNVAGISQMGLQINTGPFCQGTTPPDAGPDTGTGTDAAADVPVDTGTTTDAPVDAGTDVAVDAVGQ